MVETSSQVIRPRRVARLALDQNTLNVRARVVCSSSQNKKRGWFYRAPAILARRLIPHIQNLSRKILCVSSVI